MKSSVLWGLVGLNAVLLFLFIGQFTRLEKHLRVRGQGHSLAVNRSFAGNRDVMLIADIDQGRRPSHFNSSDAGRQHGVVGQLFRTDEGNPIPNLERDSGFQEERPS